MLPFARRALQARRRRTLAAWFRRARLLRCECARLAVPQVLPGRLHPAFPPAPVAHSSAIGNARPAVSRRAAPCRRAAAPPETAAALPRQSGVGSPLRTAARLLAAKRPERVGRVAAAVPPAPMPA